MVVTFCIVHNMQAFPTKQPIAVNCKSPKQDERRRLSRTQSLESGLDKDHEYIYIEPCTQSPTLHQRPVPPARPPPPKRSYSPNKPAITKRTMIPGSPGPVNKLITSPTHHGRWHKDKH